MGLGCLYPKNTQVHGRRTNNGSGAFLQDGQAPPAGQGFWEPMETFMQQVWDSRQVLEVLHRGAGELAWSTRYDVHDGLRWDLKREVWVGPDGLAFDGERLRDYSRGGRVNGAA